MKSVNFKDTILEAVWDVVEQKLLQERKLVIDCPTKMEFNISYAINCFEI